MKNETNNADARRCARRQAAEWCLLAVAAFVIAGSAVWAKRASVAPPPLAQVVQVQPTAPSSTPVILPARHVAPAPAAQQEPVGDASVISPPPGYERYVNGRPLRRVKTIWMTTTAYSPDHRSCGKFADGITASGKSVWTNGMKLVAADTRLLPFGTLITVPGYANEDVVPVLDRGGAIKGSRLDLLYPSHAEALEWGVQKLPVTVWEYAD